MTPPPPNHQDAEELATILSDDYTRAEFLRDRLVPKTVLFFTGEALEEDDEEVCQQNKSLLFISMSPFQFADDYGSSDEEVGDQGDDYDPQADVSQLTVLLIYLLIFIRDPYPRMACAGQQR